ncbi:MAG TPA: hypothetical protein VK828_09970 [Terriglobales bacterium]|jgi:hypothetical protein|nr:hypothetical protein [Terriglobales bacterium]
MPRMLDLIRNSQVPVNLMQSAARGSLSVTPAEMIEILVYLASHHKLFGEQARMTLAGWDEKTSVAAAADRATSPEVLGYFAAMGNLRTCLLPALAENPAVTEESLDVLAVSGTRSVVEILLASERVMSSTRLLRALQSNPILRPNELAEIGKKLADREADTAADGGIAEIEAPNEEIENAVAKYLEVNAKELAAEKDKPFQGVGITHDELHWHEAEAVEPAEVAATSESATSSSAPTGPAGTSAATSDANTDAMRAAAKAAIAAKSKKHPVPGEAKRDSTLQKIAKLDITGRIALAMRGNKEDRTILIRDSTKLVALAVLDSPKISDAEVEKIALQKNVLESVLRAIPMKRKFAKNYNIMRNIVYNPRSPLDTSLGLMKILLTRDLKNLSENKEVSETIRKMATRMFKQKLEKKD